MCVSYKLNRVTLSDVFTKNNKHLYTVRQCTYTKNRSARQKNTAAFALAKEHRPWYLGLDYSGFIRLLEVQQVEIES